MNLEVFTDADEVARAGAALLAEEARAAIAARGRCAVAVSGGSTPWKMLRAFSEADVPWQALDVFQVDERVAPAGHADRNWTRLRESLLASPRAAAARLHPMPVEDADLDAAAHRYAARLVEVTGEPAVLDLVHLGLGADGHTASLVPHDPVCEVRDVETALTALPYQGRRRMTLTYPPLDRARRVLWLVSGAEKAEMLQRLLQGDRSIPAGRVCAERALVLADRAAVEGG